MKSNKLKEKSAFFFSENSESPVFTVVAKNLMERNNISNAIEILENGISLYPKYQTAYLLLIKALISSDRIEDAKIQLQNFKTNFGVSDVYKKYEDILNSHGSESLLTNEDDILRELNDEILPDIEFEEKDIEFYSESLANIYEAQDAYSEAIKVLQHLIVQEPEKTEEYQERIEKLKLKITKIED